MYDFGGNQLERRPHSRRRAWTANLLFALGSQGDSGVRQGAWPTGAEVGRKDLVKELGAEISSGGFGPAKMGWGLPGRRWWTATG